MQGRKRKILHISVGVCSLLGLLLLVVGLAAWEGIVRGLAADNIKMGNETYDIWGEMPGTTETITIRNFTMYNFTNPHQFLYQQAKPVFHEMTNFVYEQESSFLNVQYSDDESVVSFDYWLHFEQMNYSRDVNQTVTFLNFAPLGFWAQLDTVPIYTFTLQGFGGLFVELNQTILTQAIAQGISQQFLPSFDEFVLVCRNIGVEESRCWQMWEDRFFGLNQDVNLQPWVDAAYNDDENSKQFLSSYFFPLTKVQLENLLSYFVDWSEALRIILDNWYCQGEPCTTTYLSVAQLSQSLVTNSPPPGGEPVESICSLNATCIGSPEIPTYLHNQFKKQYPDSKYQSLEFSIETVGNLFRPYQGLLNIGYLQKLFQLGEEYDKTHSVEYLDKLTKKLGMQTNDHAFVVWNWIKYMTNDFVLKLSTGGSRKIAGLGGIFSQAIYQASSGFAQWFFQDSFGFFAWKEIGDCEKYFSDNLGFLPKQKISNICQNVSQSQYTSYYSLVQPCLSFEKWQKFQQLFTLSEIQMNLYCDMDSSPSYLGELAIRIHEKIANTYNCSTESSKKCSETDLMIRQTFFSQITQNPYEGYPYQPSTTVQDWNSQIPRFQYQDYLALANIQDPQTHQMDEVEDLFTFDILLSGPAVQQLMTQQNATKFQQMYHWKNATLLRNYVRYVCIQTGFGGFTQRRTIQELVFGFTDPFLENFKHMDTMTGGDPSINSYVALNQLNSTKEQAVLYPQSMFTGFGDVQTTRNYAEVFHKNTISYNKTYFDGKNIISEFASPWAQDVEFHGSDGFQNPPGMDHTGECTVYLTALCRFGSLHYDKTIEKYGFELYDMRLNKDFLQNKYDNPGNTKYFQEYGGFLNMSFQGFPAYIGKSHFLDAPSNWSELIEVYDETGSFKMKASKWDDSYIYLEPYTGASFTATIFLQSNYLYTPDLLFPEFEHENTTMRMLPMFSVYRSGNISAEVVDEYFGDLRTAIAGERTIPLIGAFLLALSIFVFIVLKLGKKDLMEKKVSLLQSGAEQM